MSHRKSPWETAFLHGAAAVAASLARQHDRPSLAADILRGLGITLTDLRHAKVDGYDLRPLAREMRAAPTTEEDRRDR